MLFACKLARTDKLQPVKLSSPKVLILEVWVWVMSQKSLVEKIEHLGVIGFACIFMVMLCDHDILNQ